ncbi:DUF58 domain-containing protein [Gammaproteobacteria bacterium]
MPIPIQPELTELLELRHQAGTVGVASHHPVNSMMIGLYASVFRGQGMDFEETREYREGDEIRNMDWRVTARTGVPHLKVFREERERTVILCVDTGPRMTFGTRKTFKSVQAARAAALLGWSAHRHQDRVGALLYGDPVLGLRDFRPTRARRSLWQMLRSLTEPLNLGQPQTDPLLEALEKLNRSAPTGSLIFLIGDLNREPAELEKSIGHLCQRRELVLVPIDDFAEWELPAMGKVAFSSKDGQRIEIDTDDTSGRNAYREAWYQRRARWRLLAVRLGIDLLPIATHEDVRRILLEGLRLRARRIAA